MLRRLGAGAIGTATALGASETAADESSTHYHNPDRTEGFGDVTATRAPDRTYCVYGTGTPMARSQDLVNWTPMDPVLSEDRVDWRTTPEAGLWAPNVNYYSDRYHLSYYSTWEVRTIRGSVWRPPPPRRAPSPTRAPSSAPRTSV